MSPTWAEVALAGLNVGQVVVLAWLASEANASKRERQDRRERESKS
jgi:hypothetical protein